MIAAGITGYDGKQEALPPQIGAVKFYRKTWAENANIKFDEIPTRPCTDSDFDYGEDGNKEALFFETVETAGDLESYGPQMRCLVNPDDISIHGNYNTGNAAAFMVVFELCNSAKLAANPITKDLKCSGREDVAQWMS